jgi:hypothetical protein
MSPCEIEKAAILQIRTQSSERDFPLRADRLQVVLPEPRSI